MAAGLSKSLLFLVLASNLALQACASDSEPAAKADAGTTADTSTADSTGSDTTTPTEQFPAPTGCNPVAEQWDCLYPYPSDFFRVKGSQGTPRVVLSSAVMPYQAGLAPSAETALDFPGSFASDGFGITQQIAIQIPGGVTLTDLVQPFANDVSLTTDIDRSAIKTHGTLLLDTVTGQFVPHFADLDTLPPDPKDHLFMLRPAVRLEPGRRYVVALHGLKSPEGSLIVPPKTFADLQAGTAEAALQEHFKTQVFAPLTTAGVATASLQLAWDFTVQSKESAMGDMLAVREQALAVFAAAPPAVTILSVTENPDQYIARRVEGELTVPLYMQAPEAGTFLKRDATGKPVQNGTAQVPFTLLIPPSVWSGKVAGPARILQFGHGFFGTRNEVLTFPHKLGEQAGMIIAAVDWWGMCSADAVTLAVDLLTGGKTGPRFVERAHQGMVNQLALSEALSRGLLDRPELQKAGKSLSDGKFIGFYGLSQGHILGGTYGALSTRIDHVVLGVGGASFGLMMSRAAPFKPFLDMLEGASGSPAGAQMLVLLMQPILDRIDPAVWAPHLMSNTLPGSPQSRQILMHAGLADTQVPNIANHLHARLLGLPLIQPSPRQLWNLVPADAPQPSGLVEFDFQEVPKDAYGLPSGGNQVHGGQRELKASMQQIDRFLRPGGVVEWSCDGVCDPE